MTARADTPLPLSRAWWAARLWDAAVVIALGGLSLAAWSSDPSGLTPVGAALSVAGILILLWRRTLPLTTLAVTGTIGVASAALGTAGVVALPIAFACAAVVASGRRRLGAASAAVLAAVLVTILRARGEAWESTPVVGTILVLALGVAFGLVQDARRRIVQDAIDRADRAEMLREAEARRAVAEERVRIARELHDILAHHIAVIGVQAGVAEYVLESDPEAAREALASARTASTSALSELAGLLQLLRRADDDDPRAVPAPSLAHVGSLLEDLRHAGLVVDARIDDPLPALPPVIDAAAYRVVQEGLTNAHKHGDGRVVLAVRADENVLGISIRNGAAVSAGTSSSGWGLVGMRERVEGVGGTLSIDSSPHEFALAVALPTGRMPLTEKQEPR